MAQVKKALQEQARMLIEAKATILNSGDFLPATEVAKLVGSSAVTQKRPLVVT